MARFGNNNEFKNSYQNTLKQINDDKIRLLGLINNLKYYESAIEPQESIDWCNKHYK